jgi:uncharacterized protein
MPRSPRSRRVQPRDSGVARYGHAVPERLQLLFYDYVDDIVERRAPHRDAHLAHIARWKDDGRVVMAGAIGDPPHGGLLAMRVEDPAAVEDFVSDDPYNKAGLVKAWRVEPWNVVT